jgi:hypothetical protein
MKAFDSVFLEVGTRERRAIEIVDRRGRPTGTWLFREFYCSQPRCDCRRVVIMVEHVETQQIVASINHAFERSTRRDKPQTFLDPLNPQSELSSEVLALFTDMIARDHAYRQLLMNHYALWRQAVDDPAHPDHANVCGKGQGNRTFRPAVPGRANRPDRSRSPGRTDRTKPSPGDLPPGDAQAIQVLGEHRSRPKRKVQQRFVRLMKQVDQCKQRLRAWYEAKPALHRELAAYQAVVEAYQRTGHDLVCLFDRVYMDPRFTKAERKKLQALICEMAGDLLAEPGHDDLKPIYNRHHRGDFDAEAALDDAAAAHAMKSMMEDMFGVDFGDADVSSMDKLQTFAETQLHAFAQAQEQVRDCRARRKKSARQLAKEAQRDADKAKVGRVLQEVYRKLAIALHPDLEQDPGERARKTELMQQVNIAYEAGDLLRLLELQLRLEQIDPNHASEVAEDRLRHYNTILGQQLKELEMELLDLEMPWRLELDLSPSAPISPAELVARISSDREQLQHQREARRRDLESFQDVTRLKAWLRSPAARPGRGRAEQDDLFQ